MPRFAILEHTGAPDDPTGRHYDLLLEVDDSCRTWRLAEVPRAGGSPVAAFELSPHRIAWLDTVAGEVSGDRGFVSRVAAGEYELLAGDLRDRRQASRVAVSGVSGCHTLTLTPSEDGCTVKASE